MGVGGNSSIIVPCACLALLGCGKTLEPAAFARAYEQVAQVREERRGYVLLSMYQSPEYLAARAVDGAVPEHALDSLAGEYGNAYYVSLSVRMAAPTGAPEDMRNDIAVAKLIEGEDAFSRELQRLRSELSRKVFLAAPDGRRIHTVAYNLNRGFGPGAGNTFLFAFPREDQGKGVAIGKCDVVVEDFGLNLGTLRFPVKVPSRLKLKVET